MHEFNVDGMTQYTIGGKWKKEPSLGDETSSPMERLRSLCHCDEVFAGENYVSSLLRRCVPVTDMNICFLACSSIKSSVGSCTTKRGFKANTGSSRVIDRLLIKQMNHKTANCSVHYNNKTYIPDFYKQMQTVRHRFKTQFTYHLGSQ